LESILILFDCIIIRRMDTFTLTSLIDDDHHEFNEYGVTVLERLLKYESPKQLKDEEEQFIYSKIKRFIVSGTFQTLNIHFGTLEKVSIELLTKCNLKCKHCYLGEERDAHTITNDTFQNILEISKNKGAYRVALTGGEPFLDKNIFKKIKIARNLDFMVTLNTNGILLNEEKVVFLKKLKVAHITITLNGNKSQHETIYGLGTYDKTIETIALLKKHGISTGLNCMVTKYNINYISKFKIQMQEEYGINIINLSQIYNEGSAKLYNDLSLDEAEIKRINISKKCDQNYHHGLSCYAGLRSFFIHSNGDVTPCTELKFISGNLYIEPIDLIIERMKKKHQISSSKKIIPIVSEVLQKPL